jgi:hypothetical protein
VVEELLVVLDDVLGEDRDVALSGLRIQASEQGRAGVDRQAAVDDVGGEEPAEVVGSEPGAREGRVRLGDLFAAASDHVEDRGWGDDAPDGARLSPEEGQPGGHRDDPLVSANAEAGELDKVIMRMLKIKEIKR